MSMKKNYSLKALFLILALVISYCLQGQVIFTSTPDSIAIVNELYSYDVNSTYSPDAPVYSLQTSPGWMSINASTGLITGTPTAMTQGGKVIVKATNSNGSFYQTYYVYISNEVVCDPDIVAYWPMDNKEGHMIPDIANGLDANWSGPTQPEPTISSNAVAGNSIKFAPTNADDEFYYVASQDSFQFQYDDDFSVSFWFKNTPSAYTSGYYGEILMGRNTTGVAKWYIKWNNTTEKLEFYLRDNSSDDTLVAHPTVINDTLWHHVVATFNSVKAVGEDSYIHLWVDKVKALVTFDFYTDNFYGTGNFDMGWLDAHGRSYSGYLDEVVYYRKELLQADVYNLYNKGIAHQSICSPGTIAPIITSTPVTAATEDIAYSYTLTYRKADSNPIILSAPTLPAWLTFNPSTGVLSGTPTNDNVGNNAVKLSLTNGSVTIDQPFTINVANVNDLPVITSTPATSVDEDVAYSYTLTATDVDAGATLTFSAPVLPAWMSFNTSTGVLSGTPTNDQVGTAASADFDVILRVTDNTSAYVEQPFTIKVNQVNDPPVITGQNAVSTDEDVPFTIVPADLIVVDVDNVYPDDFTLTVKGGSKYTFSGNTITPDENYNGTLTVPIDLSDGEFTVSFDLSVTVNAVDDPPVFTSTPVTAGQTATAYEYWISSTDVEAQTLTLTCPTKPDWLNFSSSAGNGLLTGTPSNPGTYPVVLSVTDGTTAVEQPFSITVTGESAINDNEALLTRVYPNPADAYVEFQFKEMPGTANLKIISMDGRLMKEVNLDNQISFTLDVNDLRAGEYFFRIVSDRGEQFGKLIIK
jgi:hypothetical protein